MMRSRRIAICLVTVVFYLGFSKAMGVISISDGETHNINYDIIDEVVVDENPGSGEQTTVNLIQGGSIRGLYPWAGILDARSGSQININGGTIQNNLLARHYSNITITSGSIGRSVYAYDSSNILITGGSIGDGLHAYDYSQVTFYGYDFVASGGASFVENEFIGQGILTGRWVDGASFTMPIFTNYSTSTILAVPEPTTLILLGLGGMILRRIK